MCVDCWVEAGSPAIDNEDVRSTADLVRGLYGVAPTGGAMHIVTDDWNLEDHDIDWCLEHVDEYSLPGLERAWAVGVGAAFRALTEPERYSALALVDGFWGSDVGG